MKPTTFEEIYCAREGLTARQFQAALLRATLFPHARFLAPVVQLLDRRHFVADYEFIEDVGHLTCVADFSLPMGSYVEHPQNHRFLRRRLRLRVSVRRMLQLVRAAFSPPGAILPAPACDTFQPFPDR